MSAGKVKCALFPIPIEMAEAHANASVVTLGIRPEHVRFVNAPTQLSVKGVITSKSIVTGGQYLVNMKVGDIMAKAKVPHAAGAVLTVGGDAWVEFPIERVRVFSTDTVKVLEA